jgi:PAS domain S-box-containing protein
MPDTYFFVKDRGSRFVDANQLFVEMLGAQHLSDIVGKTDFDFSPFVLAKKFVDDDQSVMKTRTPISNRVEIVPNADGSMSWHITSKVPLYDRHGQVKGLAGVTHDLKKSASTISRYGIMTEVLEFMNRVRINKACLMLARGNGTITEIASLCGFYDHSHFIRSFSRQIGLSPQKYRVTHQ